MRKAITMGGVSGTCAAGSSLTICREGHDNRGRQNGSTHAAYTRLPTNCSSSLEVVSGAARWAVTRAVYFWRLSSPRRHDLEMEQKTKEEAQDYWASGGASGFVLVEDCRRLLADRD